MFMQSFVVADGLPVFFSWNAFSLRVRYFLLIAHNINLHKISQAEIDLAFVL